MLKLLSYVDKEMFWAVTTAISKDWTGIAQELYYVENYCRVVHFSLLCFSAWPAYAFKLCLLGFFLQIDILQEQEDH